MKFMSESFYSFRRHNTVRQRIPHISSTFRKGMAVCLWVRLMAKFHQFSRPKTWSKTRVFDQAFVLLDRVCDLLTTSSELFVSKTWSKAC